ncbi:redoxin family protein [Sphingomonas sp. KR1UV-12]|uniref:Redoxin family protein n=1 Tax=Sphingomonas aurea TaxID=3063994 RepID=A0ABT9EGL4_9SPHN|nr:redoxin family protein [Sphingomonas sp. KR1UV-12]MDP1025987.1 redoxin family protein [Sphingomonas sp. KR1UV-12]
MKRPLPWLPLIGFLVLLAVVAAGLFRPADRVVHSQLVGKPLPDFTLQPLIPGRPGLSRATLTGQGPRLLNVFASWCIPCIAEAPQLLRLKAAGVPIDAIAIRDTAVDVRRFLERNGDPYQRIGDDRDSAVQLSLGSSGVPETFLIDGQGRVVRQYVGDIRPDDVDGLIADWKALK